MNRKEDQEGVLFPVQTESVVIRFPGSYRRKKPRSPDDLPKDWREKAEALAGRGASLEELLAMTGISDATHREWMEKHEGYCEFMRDAMLLSRAWWMREGRLNLENRCFNWKGYQLNMAQRFPDAKVPKKGKTEKKTAKPQNITEEEMEAMIQAYYKELEHEKKMRALKEGGSPKGEL